MKGRDEGRGNRDGGTGGAGTGTLDLEARFFLEPEDVGETLLDRERLEYEEELDEAPREEEPPPLPAPPLLPPLPGFPPLALLLPPVAAARFAAERLLRPMLYPLPSALSDMSLPSGHTPVVSN